MSFSSEILTAYCAACQKQASNICTGCKNTLTRQGTIESVAYCSAECQREAWPTHKDECKSRKARLVVFRIGSTLQKIFYVFREKLFDRAIISIKRENGKLFIYEGPVPDPVSSCDYLQAFPDHLVKNDEEKLAVLSHLSCNDAIGWMHDLIKHMLTGVGAEVREHSVKAKATKGGLMTVNKYGVKQIAEEKLEHNILQVVMKNGLSYAIDPTCAQHGYFEAVVHWEDYLNTRVDSFTHNGSSTNFGRVKMLLLVAAGASPSFTENVFWNNQMASAKLKDTVMAWEEGEGMKVRDMCKLPEVEFVVKQEHLLEMVSWAIDEFLMGLRLQHKEWLNELAAGQAAERTS